MQRRGAEGKGVRSLGYYCEASKGSEVARLGTDSVSTRTDVETLHIHDIEDRNPRLARLAARSRR